LEKEPTEEERDEEINSLKESEDMKKKKRKQEGLCESSKEDVGSSHLETVESKIKEYNKKMCSFKIYSKAYMTHN
jgi:Skp family chaperone for outer membrane proteins